MPTPPVRSWRRAGDARLPCAAGKRDRAPEQAIDRWNQELGPLKEFILPGGSRLIALAHLCRSVTRTAERRCQQLNASETVRPVLLAYLNRLSDALFVAARLIARRQVWRDPSATRRRGSRRG